MSASPYRSVAVDDRFASYNRTADGVARSIYEASNDGYDIGGKSGRSQPATPSAVAPGPIAEASGRRVVRVTKLRVTSKQLERRGIASSTVRKARTEDARDVRGKNSLPKNSKDAKRRAATPKSEKAKSPARSSAHRAAQVTKGSAKLSDPNYKGYDATEGKTDKREPLRCKERPKDNKKKDDKKAKGSGGAKERRFIPWC